MSAIFKIFIGYMQMFQLITFVKLPFPFSFVELARVAQVVKAKRSQNAARLPLVVLLTSLLVIIPPLYL